MSLDEGPAQVNAKAVSRGDRSNHLSPAGEHPIPELEALDDDAERRSGPRLWVRVVAIGMAVCLVIALSIGGLATLTFGRATPAVVASATLEVLPGREGATGVATLERSLNGGHQLRVTVDGAATAGDARREVWLVYGGGTGLVSLGTLDDSSGVFTVPDHVSIRENDLVDVSEEPRDGDPAHSGDSIVRGALVSEAQPLT
jgi:hypothetical protein